MFCPVLCWENKHENEHRVLPVYTQIRIKVIQFCKCYQLRSSFVFVWGQFLFMFMKSNASTWYVLHQVWTLEVAGQSIPCTFHMASQNSAGTPTVPNSSPFLLNNMLDGCSIICSSSFDYDCFFTCWILSSLCLCSILHLLF